MSKWTALGGLLFLVVAGCGTADEPGLLSQPLSAVPGGPQLPLCSWVADELRGYQASIYPLRDDPDVVAVDLRGKIVCVDGLEATLRLGIVAVPPIVAPQCTICDGTPLPANVFNEEERKLRSSIGGL